MKFLVRPISKWLVLISATLFLYDLAQEFYTRSYLKGFADAIVPASASPEGKVESLLAWMARPSEGRLLDDQNVYTLDLRDPLETLNNTKLLEVCGTANIQ
jgi:hypothetical protein